METEKFQNIHIYFHIGASQASGFSSGVAYAVLIDPVSVQSLKRENKINYQGTFHLECKFYVTSEFLRH